MHIHGNSTNVNAANLYAAAQEESAAQRAASVRKKLLRSASEIDGAASPEETLMIGQWVNSQHHELPSQEQYPYSVSGKDPDLG
ncbi:MAG: hypothetical protein ACLPXT_15980 [Terracidiphilus sp.]